MGPWLKPINALAEIQFSVPTYIGMKEEGGRRKAKLEIRRPQCYLCYIDESKG